MLKKMLTLLLFFVTGTAMAQSIGDARNFLYYDRVESAKNTLNEIIQKNADNTEAYYWLMQTELQMGDTAAAREAIATVEKMRQSNPKMKVDPLVDAGKAQLLMIDGKKTEARTLSDAVVKDTRGKNADVLRALARAQTDVKQDEGDYDYALELLEQAVKRDKKNPENYLLMGDAWRRKADGGKAVTAYKQAIEADPNYARANYSIAKIYLTQQNYSVYVKHFLDAIAQDEKFAPAYYELYYFYYYRDVNEAKRFLDKYIEVADQSIDNKYLVMDLLYASGKNEEAIEMANKLIDEQGGNPKPRVFKLIAYSYDAMGDSLKALDYINTYFDKEEQKNYVAKDYTLKAQLLTKMKSDDKDQIIGLWQNAVALDTLKSNKVEYMEQIAGLYKKEGNRAKEAEWLGKIYETKEDPSNLDIYYWGLAHYAAGEYQLADSVFGIYIEKYPEQIHGYLWRAKSNAVIDSTMEQGLAVPYYAKVVEIAGDDAAKNKSLLIQAYGYIGAYMANVKKDYPVALENFQKILELDPTNADASRYSGILEKWIDAAADSDAKSTSTSGSETTTAETGSGGGKGGK